MSQLTDLRRLWTSLKQRKEDFKSLIYLSKFMNDGNF